MMEIAPRIVVDESVHSGRPVIKGTRVPVDVVLGQLAAGLTAEAVAEELPNSTPAFEIGRRVTAALALIADNEYAWSVIVVEPDRLRVRRIAP